MTRRRNRVLPWALLVAVLALAAPAGANASALWVSGSAPVGANKSCASPGYKTVQSALNAASSGAKIEICGGTYTEQLEITKPVSLADAGGSGTATVAMPAAPAESQTSCDTAVPGGQTDEISVCTAGKVKITGLNVQALAPITTCLGGLNAVNVGGGAELSLTGDEIVGASTTLDAYKGCQHGVAVLVGSHKAAVVGHATLKGDTISGYEKNGPTVVGSGSTMKVSNTTVTGEGASPWIAQNGIEVAFGGQGSVKNSTVSANECELPGVCSSTELGNQADGVLFYGAKSPSGVTSSTISGNDMGVYNASGSATLPSSPEVKVSGNRIVDNRYEGVLLEEGNTSIAGNTISGSGEVGVEVYQANYEASGNAASVNKDTIEGMSVAAVAIMTDGLAGDPAGTMKLKNSSISKNAAEVLNSSSNYTVIEKNNT